MQRKSTLKTSLPRWRKRCWQVMEVVLTMPTSLRSQLIKRDRKQMQSPSKMSHRSKPSESATSNWSKRKSWSIWKLHRSNNKRKRCYSTTTMMRIRSRQQLTVRNNRQRSIDCAKLIGHSGANTKKLIKRSKHWRRKTTVTKMSCLI